MITRSYRYIGLWLAVTISPLLWAAGGGASSSASGEPFPMPLDGYTQVEPEAGMIEVIQQRAAEEPFNVVVTIIFALAVIHTFMTARIRHWSHVIEERHLARRGGGGLRYLGDGSFRSDHVESRTGNRDSLYRRRCELY